MNRIDRQATSRRAAASRLLQASLSICALTLTAGCVSRAYVDQSVAAAVTPIQDQIDDVSDQVEFNQTEMARQSVVVERSVAKKRPAPPAPPLIPTAEKPAVDEAVQRARQSGLLDPGEVALVISLSGDADYFGSGHASLSRTARSALAVGWGRIQSVDGEVLIEVQGHTDAVGEEMLNQRIGKKRAEAVRDYLVDEYGWPGERISVVSYGEGRPIADNETAEGRARNRRVTLVVLKRSAAQSRASARPASGSAASGQH